MDITSNPHSFGAGKPKSNEYRLVIKTLQDAKHPLTRREIHNRTRIEIGNLCRILFNLTNKRRILEVAQIKPCTTTGKQVYHYYFKAKEAKS